MELREDDLTQNFHRAIHKLIDDPPFRVIARAVGFDERQSAVLVSDPIKIPSAHHQAAEFKQLRDQVSYTKI